MNDGTDDRLVIALRGAATELLGHRSIRDLENLLGQAPAIRDEGAFSLAYAAGRVLRDRLSLPAGPAAALQAFAPPRTEAERRVAALWQEMLGAERVGLTSNFFDLGGHSLLATQLVSRVRETLRLELPLRELFANPTVASLARVLSASLSGAQSPIVPSPRDTRLPLSFAQQRLWLIDQLQPGSAAYNVPLAIHLSGELSLPALH